METRGKSIFGIFFKYVSLNLLSMVSLSLYIFADTFFVANGIGSDGLAALNLAIPVFSLISGAGILIGIGGATLYAVCRGKGDADSANRVFTHSLIIAAAAGVLFTIIGLTGSDLLTRLLGADQTLFPYALPYVRTLLWFSIAFIVNQLLICFVRNDGAPKLAMAAMLSGSFSNIVLDWLFIYPLGWGMFGAAFATGLAPVISLGILSVHFLRRANCFHPARSRFSFRLAGRITVLGLPSFVTEFSSGIVMLLFNFTILRVAGNIGVAAYGVIANIALMGVAAFTGVAQGIQPILSFAYGRKQRFRVRQVIRMGLLTAFLIGCGLYLLLLLFPDAIVGIFNREGNPELQRIATGGCGLYFTAFFLMGFNIVAASCFSSTGRAFPSFLISLTRGLLAVAPLILLLPALWGMTGVWLVIPAAEAVTFAITITLFQSHRRIISGYKYNRITCNNQYS